MMQNAFAIRLKIQRETDVTVANASVKLFSADTNFNENFSEKT